MVLVTEEQNVVSIKDGPTLRKGVMHVSGEVVIFAPRIELSKKIINVRSSTNRVVLQCGKKSVISSELKQSDLLSAAHSLEDLKKLVLNINLATPVSDREK